VRGGGRVGGGARRTLVGLVELREARKGSEDVWARLSAGRSLTRLSKEGSNDGGALGGGREGAGKATEASEGSWTGSERSEVEGGGMYGEGIGEG
jgi:hypothetical protein